MRAKNLMWSSCVLAIVALLFAGCAETAPWVTTVEAAQAPEGGGFSFAVYPNDGHESSGRGGCGWFPCSR